MKKKIILVGSSIEIVTIAKEQDVHIYGIVDNVDPGIEGVIYMGDDDDILGNPEKYSDCEFVVTVDDCCIREKIYKKYKAAGMNFTSLNFGYLSPLAKIGEGCIIMSGSRISDRSKLGNNCRLNFDALVGHDNKIGDSVILAPRAVCLGHVVLNDCVYVGANSTVCPRIEVGSNVLISAGSTVARNLKGSTQLMGYYPLPKMHMLIPNAKK